MKKEKIHELFPQFQSICNVFENLECWSRGELKQLLGYCKCEFFEKVIDKAKETRNNAGEEVAHSFPSFREVIMAATLLRVRTIYEQ